MRNSLFIFAFVALLVGPSFPRAQALFPVAKEDEAYWTRLLQQVDSFSISPTQSPNLRPTAEPPTPEPTRFDDFDGTGDPNSACCTGDKPDELIFKYTPECDSDDKDACEDITITVESMNSFLFFNYIGDGDSLFFNVGFDNGFGPETNLTVNQQGESELKVSIDTSCSTPLEVGNTWGPFELVGYGYVGKNTIFCFTLFIF